MYQVKVLSNEEFDALPYPDMEVSLGVADPKTNTAYVRYTGLGEVDKYLVNHELEHLIEGAGGEHSNHYENGVYYKKFGDVMANALPAAVSMIPGIGPVAGPAMGMAMQGVRSRSSKGGGFMGGLPGVMGAMSQDGGGSPMDSFQAPQSPNIVTPGAKGGMGTSGIGGSTVNSLTGGGSPIERVRGFFSSRSPQGAF